MIAYLEKDNTTVEVPDDIGEKDLADISGNLHSYIEPKPTPEAPQDESQEQSQPTTPKWTPNFYESFVKPNIPGTISALSLTGLPLVPPRRTPETEAFGGKAIEEATFGLAKSLTDQYFGQEYKDHPAFATAGQFAGGLGSLLETGYALGAAGLTAPAAGAGKLAVDLGLASGERFIPRAIMSGATFGTRTFIAETVKAFQDGGVDLERFGKDVLRDTAFGSVLGGVGGLSNSAAAIASAGGLGFISKKMEGGDNREALLNGAIWAAFETVGSVGRTPNLRSEAINNLTDSVADYVGARNTEGTLGKDGAKTVSKAFVDSEIKKAGFKDIDDLVKSGPENTLQVIENINQIVRKGIIPAEVPPTPVEPPKIETEAPTAVPETPTAPTQPEEPSPIQKGLEAVKGFLGIKPDISPEERIDVSKIPLPGPIETVPPDMKDIFHHQQNVVEKEESKKKIDDISNRLDTVGLNDEEKKAIFDQYDLKKTDVFGHPLANLEGLINQPVEQQYQEVYSTLAKQRGIEGTKVDQGTMEDARDTVNSLVEGYFRPTEKPLQIDTQGLPIRRPGSVVSRVMTPDNRVAKITHQMVLDEAGGLLSNEQEIHSTTDPLVDFVRNHGGIKGFKGGVESEEFKKVPIHLRGQIDADEMAQMAYDRNLLEEPNGDLLRNHLASIKPKGPAPKLGDFYSEAQRNLEEYFSTQANSMSEKKPGFGDQQELSFESPYEEDKIPKEKREAPAEQQTVRGGFKAILKPHLEVEFKQNGFLVFPNRKIQSPADLAYGFKFLHNEAQENFFLGAIKDGRIVAVEHLGVGTIDQVVVYPYETISLIDRKEADSFFIVHNHPSGAVTPSYDDKTLTNSIKRVMENNGIEFKGHVIIDDTKFGFISPDGSVSEETHAEKKEGIHVPILKKYYEWIRPKSSIIDGPLISSPSAAFELFKGIQKGHDEGVAYLLDTQNSLLNAVVIPHKQFNTGTLQRLAAAYRASGIITVNSGMNSRAYQDLKRDFMSSQIRLLDDVDVKGDTYESKRSRFGEQSAEYKPEETSLVESQKENISERYNRLRQQAIEQGMNPIQATKYAKDNLGREVSTPTEAKPKQQEFGVPGGVEGFGQGKKDEQSLFEPSAKYILTPEFKKWFGDSKVVDKDGEPSVVYHGTTKDFEKFDKDMATMGGITWFTSEPKTASVFAGSKGDIGLNQYNVGSNIKPLYASIKNPASWAEYEKYGLGQLKSMGYDGAILRNKDGSFDGFVFEPTQLKSVTGNTGKFSSKNPNILREPKSPYDAKTVSEIMGESANEIKNVVSPTSAAPLAAQITREQLGKMARSYDKAEASLESASKFFKSQSAKQNTDFIDRMEHGVKQETPELEKIAKQLRILLDEKRQEIRTLGTGKLDSFIENYFPHIWDQSEKKISQSGQKAARRPFEGSKSFLKKRTVETFKEGIEMGLTPTSFNPVDLTLLKMREMDKYLMAHRTLNEFKQEGLSQFVRLGKEIPDGWVKIDDKISTVMAPIEGEEGQVKGLMITGHYYAQPDAARIINNYLSPGLQNSAIYRAFRYAGNFLNQFQLGFSLFHLGFTSMDAVISKSALALNQLFEGHPIKAIQSALQSPFAPVENIIRGNRLFKAWRGEDRSPFDEIMATTMESAGGRSRMDQFYATKAYDQMKKLFQAGKPIKGIFHLPLTIAEFSSKPILEYIVPRQKLGVFADIMKMEMENNPDMTHEEMRATAQRAWDSVDNRMGQLIYDNLFWNRTLKDLLMVSVRSVGWNLGTIRELAGGAKDMAQMPIDLAKGKKTNLSYRAAYFLALPILTGILSAIYQYLRTGKGPSEMKDYFFPKTGGVDKNGDPNRVALPSYMKDVYHYKTAPLKTLGNKLNPLLAIMAQMLENKDFYGAKIRNEDDPLIKQALSEVGYMVRQLEPFGFRNTERQLQSGNRHLADVVGPWVGITPAPYDINQTKAEKLAHEIIASHQMIGARTQEQIDRSRFLNDMTRLYQLGDPKAKDDLFKAYEQGKISRRQMQDVIANSNLTPLQKMVKRFTAEETQKVYDASNQEEKNQIEPILQRKVLRHEHEYALQSQ